MIIPEYTTSHGSLDFLVFGKTRTGYFILHIFTNRKVFSKKSKYEQEVDY